MVTALSPLFSGKILRDPSIAKVRRDSAMPFTRIVNEMEVIQSALDSVQPEIDALPDCVTLRYSASKPMSLFDPNQESMSLSAPLPTGETLEIPLGSFGYASASDISRGHMMVFNDFKRQVGDMLEASLKLAQGLVAFYQIQDGPKQKEL